MGKTFNKYLFALLLILLSSCSEKVQPLISNDSPVQLRNEQLEFIPDGVQAQAAIYVSATLSSVILPPSTALTSGVQTYANDVTVSGSTAYTSFNSVGSPQAGAIYAVTGILTVPLFGSAQYYTDFDANHSAVVGTDLYVVGAKDLIGAYVYKHPLSGVNIGASTWESSIYDRYAGTSIVSSGSGVYIATGDNGALTTLDTTTNALAEISSMTDIRDVAFLSNGDALVLAGQPGRVRRVTAAGATVWETSIGGASIAQSKSQISLGSTYAAVSKGDGGLSILCLADGVSMATTPQITVAGYPSTATVTNGVALIPGGVLSASGDGGVNVYSVTSAGGAALSSNCANIAITSLGRISLGSDRTANGIVSGSVSLVTTLVRTYTGVLLVASGPRGFMNITFTYTYALGDTVLSL